MTRILILSLAIVLNATANILIKIGMMKIGETDGLISLIRRALTQPALYGGIVSFALALGAYGFVLSRLNLSVAYPVMVSMGLIIVVLVSYFVLHESISLVQIGGFLLIISGVWIVAR